MSFNWIVAVFILVLSTQSQAWIHGYRDDDSGLYCAMDGIFSGPKKCIDYEAAKKLNFDAKAIYGADENNLQMLSGLKNDLDMVVARQNNIGSEMQRTKTAISQLKESSESPSTCAGPQKVQCLENEKNKIIQIQNSISDNEKKLTEQQEAFLGLKMQSDEIQKTLSEEQKKQYLKMEALSEGLLANTKYLKNRLEKLDDNLAQIENAFNDSILEAYVYSKMEKMAANLCAAAGECSKEGGKNSKEKLMSGVFDKERIKKNFTPNNSSGSSQ